jgi:hypothetical protein
MDKEHEGQMIDGFRNEMKEKIKGRPPDPHFLDKDNMLCHKGSFPRQKPFPSECISILFHLI